MVEVVDKIVDIGGIDLPATVGVTRHLSLTAQRRLYAGTFHRRRTTVEEVIREVVDVVLIDTAVAVDVTIGPNRGRRTANLHILNQVLQIGHVDLAVVVNVTRHLTLTAERRSNTGAFHRRRPTCIQISLQEVNITQVDTAITVGITIAPDFRRWTTVVEVVDKIVDIGGIDLPATVGVTRHLSLTAQGRL